MGSKISLKGQEKEPLKTKFKLPQLEVEPWVSIRLVLVPLKPNGKSDWGKPGKVLKSYDLPRELYFRRAWVIRWRAAKLQCKYPKHKINHCYTYYDKKFGFTQLHKTISRFNSAKGQVTRVLNAIGYLKSECESSLFDRVEDHPKYPLLEKKLAQKKQKVDDVYQQLLDVKNAGSDTSINENPGRG